MSYLPLDGAWSVTAVSGPAPADLLGRAIPATVPGTVHVDLRAAGLIDDWFDGDNEAAQQWIGSTVWRYRRTFTWHDDGAARHDLVAQGLDTLATVEVNGTGVLRTANQHRTYRVDVGRLLREGDNELTVTLDAPVPAAERLSVLHGGALPHVNHHPFNALRKTASSFGWDWGIDVAGCGIWRPIGIESWSGVRIAAVRPLVSLAGSTGVLTTAVELEHDGPASSVDVTVVVRREGTEVARGAASVHGAGEVVAVVPDVDLWWPVGHGAQPLYDVEVTAGDARWAGRVGFRTVTLDTEPDNTEPDEHGTPFILRVNGETVLVRGANWIPDHAMLTEVTRERYEQRIADALEANMNLLRVWGGGIYESEDFYALCDEHGLLVWQDFLFACAAYAEEPWLADEVAAEAREAVTRLSAHPSLALWNGSNENLLGHTHWGWRTQIGGRTWGDGYYHRLLPAIVAELDPTRPYTPSSPYSVLDHLDPNDERHGTVHIWDVWNEKDYRAYRDWTPRFVAEFGFQGPPAWTTLTDVVHDLPLDPHGPQMLVHQKAEDGNGKLARGLAGHLPAPTTVDDWHALTSLNQAHAVRFGIEHFRSLTPYTTGCIVWQLNDDWPVISWAAVDFAGRRKPLWYALRAAYAPRLATVQPRAGGLAVVLVNDTGAAVDARVRVVRERFDGEVLAEAVVAAHVGARDAATLALGARLTTPDDAGQEILVATPEGQSGFARAVWNFAEPVEQRLAPDALDATVTPTPTGCLLELRARSYVRDVLLLADRAHPDARADEALLTLVAGETATVTLEAGVPLDGAAVLDPLVLRSVNQLVAPRPTPGLPPAG